MTCEIKNKEKQKKEKINLKYAMISQKIKQRENLKNEITKVSQTKGGRVSYVAKTKKKRAIYGVKDERRSQ